MGFLHASNANCDNRPGHSGTALYLLLNKTKNGFSSTERYAEEKSVAVKKEGECMRSTDVEAGCQSPSRNIW